MKKKKPGPKGPRITTIIKQVEKMNLAKGESVVLHGLKFTRIKDGLEFGSAKA